jgi:hypothetical protein
MEFLIGFLIILLYLALSWGTTIGIVALICVCFKLTFSLRIATGIWLVLVLISSFFKVNIQNKQGK